MTKWRFIIVASLSAFLMSCANTSDQTRSTAQTIQSDKRLFAYSESEMSRYLQRGVTHQNQVAARFGQPLGISQSGDFTYWNYLDSRVPKTRGEGKASLATLNVVFNPQGILVDYNFQSQEIPD
ncbi:MULTISPECIES: hypothetical protein [Gammaproteobacteria]|uniref:hypothetical protein n=1 Tax=Gammaproteobacteria TaxID=1236 RepID=UPI000DD048F5|nr:MULTISPECIES: hypothetical protein [Gammaproteobacteria]RTE87163.1 hypothetical protein DQX04_01865 [Aliidiomarina sp. B3213]TCZ93049.1 hypothetical protein EYQ95_03440 [Lysobacter sp. N42]